MKSIKGLFAFKEEKKPKNLTATGLRSLVESILKEEEEKASDAGYASVDTGTNIADLDGIEAYRQLTSGDENAPLIQAMMAATDKTDADGNVKTGWAPGALGKAGGAQAIKDWAESVGESELASRISKVGSALPGTGLPKKDMPALEGEDAEEVKDALSPGGKYNVDIEPDYAGGEPSVEAWMDSLSDEDQKKLASGEEPEIKEEGFLREDKFPAPGTIKGGGKDPVGQALAFLVKGKHDGNQTDDTINVQVGGSLPNSKMIPTHSNICILYTSPSPRD